MDKLIKAINPLGLIVGWVIFLYIKVVKNDIYNKEENWHTIDTQLAQQY